MYSRELGPTSVMSWGALQMLFPKRFMGLESLLQLLVVNMITHITASIRVKNSNSGNKFVLRFVWHKSNNWAGKVQVMKNWGATFLKSKKRLLVLALQYEQKALLEADLPNVSHIFYCGPPQLATNYCSSLCCISHLAFASNKSKLKHWCLGFILEPK